MSKVCFCRAFHFEAFHHYAVPGWDAAKNSANFGDAAKPHKHHWTLTIWLQGPLDPVTGMVVDLVHVDQVLEQVAGGFSGKNFRDVDPYFKTHQPTTEVLAIYFAEKLKPHFPGVVLARLRIAEMNDLFAEWTP